MAVVATTTCGSVGDRRALPAFWFGVVAIGPDVIKSHKTTCSEMKKTAKRSAKEYGIRTAADVIAVLMRSIIVLKKII